MVISLPPLNLSSRTSEAAGMQMNDNSLTFLLQHAQQVSSSLHLTPDNLAPVTELCHRLDGVPGLLEIGFVRPCFAESHTRFQVLGSVRAPGLAGAIAR